MGDLEVRVCRDDEGQQIVSASCPRWSACNTERNALSQRYNSAMTDDEVVALLGPGAYRDETGAWQRGERADLNRIQQRRKRARRAVVERSCLSCGIDPDERDHLPWCDDAPSYTWGEAQRDCKELEHAIRWQPKVQPRRLTTIERTQLQLTFDALITRDREETA